MVTRRVERSRSPWRPPDLTLGDEPDYRFTLANERTFLAWIRTSLALIAGGLAVTSVLPTRTIEWAGEVIGLLLVALGSTLSIASFSRWARTEEAIRQGQPLPPSRIPRLLAIGVVVVSIVALSLLLLTEALA